MGASAVLSPHTNGTGPKTRAQTIEAAFFEGLDTLSTNPTGLVREQALLAFIRARINCGEDEFQALVARVCPNSVEQVSTSRYLHFYRRKQPGWAPIVPHNIPAVLQAHVAAYGHGRFGRLKGQPTAVIKQLIKDGVIERSPLKHFEFRVLATQVVTFKERIKLQGHTVHQLYNENSEPPPATTPPPATAPAAEKEATFTPARLLLAVIELTTTMQQHQEPISLLKEELSGARARADWLAAKQDAGSLTTEEKSELEQLMAHLGTIEEEVRHLENDPAVTDARARLEMMWEYLSA